MPIRASEKARYPDEWAAIRTRILARAENRCEFVRADGTRCNAPNYVIIARSVANLEVWWDEQEALDGMPHSTYVEVRVVLTVAHLNHIPEDCRDENLLAGCQLHHLRYDQAHHQQNAAVTRRAKKGNMELFREDGEIPETPKADSA